MKLILSHWSQPWLWLTAPLAHRLSPLGVSLAARLKGASATPQWQSLQWKNLNFPNRLGIAGGVDKNGRQLKAWADLGVGFLEVGTVTPMPQSPNPGPIMDRNIAKHIVWNKMGFPNEGLNKCKEQIQKFRPSNSLPLFVNIGKNRSTPNHEAHKDYIQLIQSLGSLCDAFVINISSPNTKSLRELLDPHQLSEFLGKICTETSGRKPLLLKLSPDIENSQLADVIRVAISHKIEGFVLTNTLANNKTHFPEHDGGGVSGRSLSHRSKEVLSLVNAYIKAQNGPKPLLISVGGVDTAQDVLERIELGADLVQVYSALVFHGPCFFLNIAREIGCH